MRIIHYFSLLVFPALLVLSSCKKDPPDQMHYGSVKFEFENFVGDSALVLDTKSYFNANGDIFYASSFKYYISNIKLHRMDGTFAEPEGYHLLDHSIPGSLKFTISNVPVGNYTSVSFMIGVDSLHNVSGAQTGALDPANGMFWDWNNGYIMAKFEGISPQSGAFSDNLTFHIAGFSGTSSVLKTVNPSFGNMTANVSETITPEIHIRADLAEWFTTPYTIDFSTVYTVSTAGSDAKMIADNYADMFTVEHIHN